jgi:hypothetical protein
MWREPIDKDAAVSVEAARNQSIAQPLTMMHANASYACYATQGDVNVSQKELIHLSRIAVLSLDY